MSRETRTVRPFVGLDALERCLDHTTLYFGQEPCEPNSSLAADIEIHEFLIRPVSLEWVPEGQFEAFRAGLLEACVAAGIAPESVSLAAVAMSGFLKLSQVVLNVSLVELDRLDRVVDLAADPRPDPFRTPFNGFGVDVYLLLSEAVDARPLKPSKKGTWLSRVSFRIDTHLAPALLPPTPLTGELRQQLGLPARTLRYLQFGDHDLLEPYREQEQPVFYVDEDILAQLSVRRTSAASKAIQLQLAQDFVAAVVRRAAGQPDLETVAYDDVRESLLGSVIRLAAGPKALDGDRQTLLVMVRNDPEYVIARAEHFVDVASGFVNVLKDGDS
ncbi:MAG: hypothetical protein WD184_05315 [Acidimicrobiia bacterium]